MRWAIARGYQEDNPADEPVVAALGRNTKPPTHHHSQVASGMETIKATGTYWAAQAALRFLILTATRSCEFHRNPGREVT